MVIQIEPIDPDDIPTDTAPNRRGRPKTATKTSAPQVRRTAAEKRDVDTALATMDSIYGGLSTGLLIMGRPMTANLFAAQAEETRKANKQAFEASPSLAASVARLGQVSAVGMFIGAQMSLIAPCAIAFAQEGVIAKEAKARAAAEQASQQDGPGFP